MILNIFKKSYNKWRLEDSGVPGKHGKQKIKVQAVCMHSQELFDNEYQMNIQCSQRDLFINIDAFDIRPFAIIWDRGQTQHM